MFVNNTRYNIFEVLTAFKNKTQIDGVDVFTYKNGNNNKLSTASRYLRFIQNTIDTTNTLRCSICGAGATHFRLESVNNTKVFHLYGKCTLPNGQKRTTLFNRDHIIPVSLGGKDMLENYRLTCKVCNTSRGSTCDSISEYKNMKSNIESVYLKHLIFDAIAFFRKNNTIK